jgi:hypothetical protein
VHAGIGLNLGAVERHMPELGQPRRNAWLARPPDSTFVKFAESIRN